MFINVAYLTKNEVYKHKCFVKIKKTVFSFMFRLLPKTRAFNKIFKIG